MEKKEVQVRRVLSIVLGTQSKCSINGNAHNGNNEVMPKDWAILVFVLPQMSKNFFS